MGATTIDAMRSRDATLTDSMRRSLGALRAAGVPVAIGDLACRLLALAAPPAPPGARRLVADLLGAEPEALPDRLVADDLRPAADSAVAALPIERARFAVIDLETTGLSSEHDAIIEIGAVRVGGGRIESCFETLVRPPGPGPLSSAIAALTGIEDAMLADAPSAQPALTAFAHWLGEAPAAPWVAHNAAFDSRFLRRAFHAQWGRAPDAAVLCTQRLARRLLPRLGRYNLDHLCAHFGIANSARHRALGDARATARAWIELLVLARAEGHASVGDLLDLQERPTRRKRRARPRLPAAAAPQRG